MLATCSVYAWRIQTRLQYVEDPAMVESTVLIFLNDRRSQGGVGVGKEGQTIKLSTTPMLCNSLFAWELSNVFLCNHSPLKRTQSKRSRGVTEWQRLGMEQSARFFSSSSSDQTDGTFYKGVYVYVFCVRLACLCCRFEYVVTSPECVTGHIVYSSETKFCSCASDHANKDPVVQEAFTCVLFSQQKKSVAVSAPSGPSPKGFLRNLGILWVMGSRCI